MNICSFIVFVILKVSFGQEFKKHFCYFGPSPYDISCGENELVYVTAETYGAANYVNGTCVVDSSYMTCLYKPLESARYLTTGSNCNGKTRCTLQRTDLGNLFKQYLSTIRRNCTESLNLTNLVLEVEYQCISDSIVHRGCNETYTTTSLREVQLLAKQTPLQCLCMAQGTASLTVRALHLQNDMNVFSVADDKMRCIIYGTQQYNNLILCSKNASIILVRINNDRYQDNRMWLRFSGDGNISVRCDGLNETPITPSIIGTEDSFMGSKISLKDYYVYIAISVSVVILVLVLISIAICLHRRNRSKLNVKNLETENRAEQRLYDYSDVNALNGSTDNVHNPDTNYNTADYNLAFSERQQYQEQNGHLYDTRADYNQLSLPGHAQPKPPNDLNLYDTTGDSVYNKLTTVKKPGADANPGNDDYDHAPTFKRR